MFAIPPRTLKPSCRPADHNNRGNNRSRTRRKNVDLTNSQSPFLYEERFGYFLYYGSCGNITGILRGTNDPVVVGRSGFGTGGLIIADIINPDESERKSGSSRGRWRFAEWVSEGEKAMDGWLLGDVDRKELFGGESREARGKVEAEGCASTVDAALCPRPPRLQRAVWRDVSVPDNLITSQHSTPSCAAVSHGRYLALRALRACTATLWAVVLPDLSLLIPSCSSYLLISSASNRLARASIP